MQKHALVVEDQQYMRWLIQEALEDERYQVDTAADGLVALEKLELFTQPGYDVMTLDLTMPYMGGLQVLRNIQQRALIALSSIIVISGDGSALRQASRIGVSTLNKPFDLDALLALVYSIASKRDLVV